jgi:branched-chain amino acid transport system substrate-binding protein
MASDGSDDSVTTTRNPRPESAVRGISRRTSLGLIGASAIALPSLVRAQATSEVEIAVIDSFSGPWAFNGQVALEGAKLAVEEINAGGGVRALNGAKLKLVSADAGGTPEEAGAAVRRVLASSPNLVAGTGAYVSSLQLAITEVTERAGIPWIVMGAADQLTARGFKSVIGTNMSASQSAARLPPMLDELAKLTTGGAMKDVAIVSENTASTIAFATGIRKDFASRNVKIVYDETYSVGISDGAAIAQQIRRSNPSMFLFLNTVPQDAKVIIGALKRINITMSKLPTFIYGAGAFIPEMLNIVDKETMEGAIGWATNWTTKDSLDVEEAWKKRTSKPWMTFEPKYAYGHVWMIKEALEKVGSPDKTKLAEQLRSMHVTSGPISKALGGEVKFDANGRRDNAPILLMQWQNGVPVTIYPNELAVAKPLKLG